MAIQVDVNTTTATANVNELATQLDRLAAAADKFNDTKLGSGLAQEFASLRSTMNELRDAMAGANSVFAEMRKQSSANSAANKMLESSLKGVRGAIEAQTASLKVQGAVLRATVKEQEALTKSQREAQAYLERQKTTQQKVSEELRKFAQIAKENNITGREHARIVELITQSHKGAGLEIERVGQKLKAQVEAWGKSNEELLKATSGWDLLSEKTQKSLLYHQRMADTQKVLNKYLITETTELQKHKDAYELLVKARQNGFLKGRQNAELYQRLRANILAAIEKETQAERELADARKAAAAIKPPSAHGWGQDPAKLREAAQASRDWLNSLREQAGVIPKVNSQVAALASHMKNLTADQQAEARSLINLTTIQSQFSKYIGETTLGLSKYEKEILKSENALRELEAAKKSGVFDGREQMYLEIQKNITAEIERQRQAQEGLNNAKNKTQRTVATQDEYARAVENLNKLRDSMYIIPKVATETEEYRKKVAALNAEQQKEYATLTQLQADMKKIGPLYQRSIPPIQKYTEIVEAARRAHQRYLDTSGKMGIAANTMSQIIGKARLDYLKANTSSELLSKGILGLTGRFNVLNQVTAASRAAMIGAGQSFGIFEGRTIAVAASVYALARAIRSSITTGMEFEYSMTKVGVLMSEISDVMSGGFSQNAAPVRALREEIIRLGADTQFTATEVASAAEILARSGQDAGFIYANLEHVLDLAAVAMTDMANAADIATAVMASFGGTGYALSDAVDVLAATSVKSKATIDDLGLSLQYIGPLAAQAGLDFKETASILGVLADVNIRGSKAGTAFRRMLISLAAPTDRAKKALEGLGIEWEKLDLSGGGLERFFVQLNQMGLSAIELQRVLRDVFGVYAISATTALTQAADKIGEFNKALNQTQGFAARMRDELRNNLKMAVEELTSEWEALQITAFDTFGPRLREQIEALTRYLEDNRGAIADTISSTVNGLTTIVTTVAEYHKAILNLAKAYLVLKVSSAFIAGGIGLWKKGKEAMDAYRASVAATAIATKAANTSTLGLGMGAGAAVKQVSRLGTAASFVGGILGGWVGAIALVVTGLAMWATSAKETTDRVTQLSSAMDQINSFELNLKDLSSDRVHNLNQRLLNDLELVPIRIKEQEAALKSLRDQYQETFDTEDDLRKRNHIRQVRYGQELVGFEDKIQKNLEDRKRLQGEILKAENELLDRQREKDRLMEAQSRLFNATLSVQIELLENLKETSEDLISNNFITRWVNSLADSGIHMLKLKQDTLQLKDYLKGFTLGSGKEELEGQLIEVDRWIRRLTNDSLLAAAAVNLVGKPLEDILKLLSDRREDILSVVPKTFGADPEIAKAANELKAYFDAYEKAKGPVYAVNRELAEVDRWVGEIAAKTPRAVAAMKEAGIGMEDAMAALDFAKNDLSMGFLEAAIGGVDSRFKDLRKTLAEVEDQELSLESATQLLWNALNDPKNAAVTKALGGAAEAFNRLFPLINKTLDSSAALTKEWEKLSKEAAEFEVSITGNSDSLEDLVKRYSALPDVTKDAARSTIALVSAKELLGDALKKTRDETETLAMAQWSLNELVANGTITAERATKAYNQLWASQPIGKLKAETIQRQAQIALIGKGAREQAIYNAAVSEFGANWMYADQAFKDAAGSLYDVNYELERATELHDTYMEFGEGVIGIFADMASGMETSFSNAADSLRDLMKKLLRDLIFMALRNKIMVGLGLEGSGSGSGQSSVWGWAQTMMSFFGGGRNAKSGGGGQGGFTGTVMNGAQFLASGSLGFYGPSGSASASVGASTGGSSVLSNIFSASNWVNVGKNIYSGFSGMLFGTGQTTQIGSMLGTSTAGQWAPTGLGTAGLAVAGLTGAYYGYRRSGNIAGAAGYGALGLGAAGAAMGAASGAGMIAGATGAFASLGGAAFIPVLGWILAIAAVVDMVAGGKLFGTSFRPESITSALNLSEEGGRATQSMREVRNRALFQGRRWRDVDMEVSPEMEAAAQQFYNQVFGVMADAAARLATDTPPMIDAALRTVIEYDKKGRETATKYFVDVLGRTWEEETAELASTRITAEAIISVIDSVFQTVADSVPPAPVIPDFSLPPDFGIDDQIVMAGYAKTLETISNMVGEASQIAERWRSDAEMLLDGAQFLLLAATDLRKGFGLLKDEGGLTEIADLIEALAKAGESLSDTYVRVYQSTTLLDQAFALAGATTDKSRVEFVKFATQVTEAMGGLDEATQKWNAFYSAFYNAGELAQYQQEQMLQQGGLAFAGIGLNFGDFMTETGLADFRQLYEEALPTLSPAQVAQWVEAGLALAQFTEAMHAIDDVIETNAMNLAREQMTSFERDMSSLAEDFQALRDEAEALGATTEQLAILDGQYAEARQRMEKQFREEINTILSDNAFALQRESMTEYQLAVHDLNNRFDEMRDKLIDLGATSSDLAILEQQRAETMEQLVAQLRKQLDDFMISQDPTMGFLKLVNDLEAARKQAVALGASEAQLTRLRKIAELEMARFIADLRRSIASSIEGLSEYLGLSGQIEGNYESARDMAEDLYELERRRYEMAQKAIENITKYLKDLETGDLAPGDWRSRLGAGRSNFDEMLELARGGDETALNEITRYADTLLKLGRETLGDTQAYANLYDYVTGSLRDLMADLALIPAPPEAPTGGDSSASGSVSGSTTGGMTDLEAYWAILELATQIGSLSVATGESVYTLLDEFGIPLLTLTQGMGVSLSNLDMEGLNSLSLLATAFNTNLPEMLNELKISPDRVAELLGINLEDVRLGIMGGFEGLAEYLGVSIPEALNYVGISVAELAPAFGLYIDNLSENTLANLGLMADALGILPTDLAELLGVPLADIATSFGYELGLSSEENFKALRTLASSLGMSLFDLGQAIGEDFGVIVSGLNTDLSSVFSELPEGIGPEVKENLEDLLNNVANAADPKEVQNAVGNLLAFTRDNLPGGIATSLANTLNDLGLGIAEEHGLTDIYSRLGDVRTATRDVERVLSNTINGTLSSGFGNLSNLLIDIRNSLMGEELIEEVPEIAGWGGEGEGIARVPAETPGDQYMEAKALEAEQDDGMEDLYTRLEESQAQVVELTEKLTEATESLHKLQADANQRLGKIVGNTRQTAKRTRETKKA